MDSFESFDIIHYDNYELHKKEKLSSRFFGSKTFRVVLTVLTTMLTVVVCFIIYNDIKVSAVDYRKQKFAHPEEQSVVYVNGNAENDDGKININTATVKELMLLENIGSKRASYIVEYRKENGNFRCIEEILNVRSMSNGVYYSIKDYITVE